MDPKDSSLKETLRAEILALLRALSPNERHVRSRTICERVLALPVWKNARVVAAFEPMGSEPEIAPLSDDARVRGAEVITILPSARKHEDVVINMPIDVVLVPGIAFTHRGDRLGRGGGFFDRFLAHRAPAVKIGVCFDFQIVESLPLERHDVKLDLVVSD